MARPLEVVRHCCLAGTNLERADLRYMDLRGVNFTNSNLRGADLSHADCRGTIFVKADLSRACLYNTNCEDADFSNADLTMSYLRATNFIHATMWWASLRRVTAKNAFFLGARFGPPLCKTDQMRNVDKAVFHWYWDPQGGIPSYDPKEGYVDLWHSVLGGISLQENAATRKT